MNFVLVQGKTEGDFTSYFLENVVIRVDKDIEEMYPERLKLDYVPGQGFRLLTTSQYLATHLTILENLAQY